MGGEALADPLDDRCADRLDGPSVGVHRCYGATQARQIKAAALDAAPPEPPPEA